MSRPEPRSKPSHVLQDSPPQSREESASITTLSAYLPQAPSTPSLRKVQIPRHMRSRFLERISQLPPHLLSHLERYIPPNASNEPPSSKISVTAVLLNSNTSTHGIGMESRVYDSTGETEVASEVDPQIEGSSAAQKRAECTHQSGYVEFEEISGSTAPTTISLNVDHADDTDFSKSGAIYKSWATTKVSREEQVVYSSSYTRPAQDVLRDILEVRYPLEISNATKRKWWWAGLVDRVLAGVWGYERIEES